jgi:hypothetical protein
MLLAEEAGDLAALLRTVVQTALVITPGPAAAAAAAASSAAIMRAHAQQQAQAKAWSVQAEQALGGAAAAGAAAADATEPEGAGTSTSVGKWLAVTNPALAERAYGYGARLARAGIDDLERLLGAEPEELGAALDAELPGPGRPQVLPAHRRRIMREHEAQRSAELLDF